MEYAVEIQNLTKDYETGFLRKKRVRALDGLSLNVEPGQIVGFLGGNGAGKTTTIKTLMRLQFPTSGTARILGRDINDVQMHRRIGYCPENPYFYDYLTAIELANWMALYVAAGSCCVIAMALSCATTMVEVVRERGWSSVNSLRSAILFVPKIWWRWQKLYLTSMPVTLGIVILFATSMRWS